MRTSKYRGAQPGRHVAMRVLWGEVPGFGDVLITASGKRYQVIHQVGRALRALVLAADDELEPGTRVWNWRWGPRPPANDTR